MVDVFTAERSISFSETYWQRWTKYFLPQEQSFKLKISLHIPFTLMWWFPQFFLSFPGRSVHRFSNSEPGAYWVEVVIHKFINHSVKIWDHLTDIFQVLKKSIKTWFFFLVLFCFWTPPNKKKKKKKKKKNTHTHILKHIHLPTFKAFPKW